MPGKFLLCAASLLALTCNKKSGTTTPPVTTVVDTSFTNPLLPSGPDPWVEQQDTMYYYTSTRGDRISIWATSRMSNLRNARMTTIWSPPSTGSYSKEIWAPEVHHIGNAWYAYFAADDGNNANHRIYALECDDADPMTGAWTFKGKIADTTADKWAIDASVFEYDGQLYMVWSGWEGNVNVAQNIYIAKMKDPLTLEGSRVLISSPSAAWENMGAPPAVNEGPEAIVHNDRLFLTFSASGCWTDSYALGLLTLAAGGNPLSPGDWTKSTGPVFTTSAMHGAYAPGHNGFFISRDGKESWIVYHANSQSGQGCGDARNPRMQRFSWDAMGAPVFGDPSPINTPIRKPGGE